MRKAAVRRDRGRAGSGKCDRLHLSTTGPGRDMKCERMSGGFQATEGAVRPEIVSFSVRAK